MRKEEVQGNPEVLLHPSFECRPQEVIYLFSIQVVQLFESRKIPLRVEEEEG